MSASTQLHTIGNHFKHRLTIWLVSLALLVFIVWAGFASLDEIVRGPGKVIPTSQTQVIQSLEGGILAELQVQEGDEVASGDVIARLSDTKFKGAYGELVNEYQSLQLKLTRLRNELDKKNTFEPTQAEQNASPDVAESEMQLFHARWTEYETSKVSLTNATSLHDQELNLLKKMAKRGVVPEIDVLKAAQQSSEAHAKLNKLESDYVLQRSEEYADTLNEINKLEQTLSIRKDQLKRTTLKAPVRSIVNKILVTTIGGVIAPGEEILELIPLDDELRVEAKISPKDIAFIYPGMRATIKLTAYDYTIYGNLSGTVKHISADTFEDTDRRDAPPYYKVNIEVDQASLEQTDKDIEIRPGMLAEAELHVGQKTVLKYLLKPLFKTTEAFREP